MAAPRNLHGKGILFVRSKIIQPDILDEKTFLKWYNEEHIVDVVETSGVHSAFRFLNVDRSVAEPYLAIYPMKDLGFTQTEEFRGIRVKSDILPNNDIVYDMAEFHVRYDNLIFVYDESKKGKDTMKSMVAVETELKEGDSYEELTDWYREHVCPAMAKHKSYLRTTNYKLAYARSNAQSRVLKGLATVTEEPLPESPTYLSIHEFECEAKDLSLQELKDICYGPRMEKMAATFKVHDSVFYQLENQFGDRDLFQGVEM